MKLVKNISFYLIIAVVLTLLASFLDSDFLFKYLNNRIIGLLITLLAINTATSGLIASKIQDILIEYPKLRFKNTIKEMKLSLKEQIILISCSVLILVVSHSDKVHFTFKQEITNVILLAILIYAVDILWDTGKAIFIVIEQIQKLKDRDK